MPLDTLLIIPFEPATAASIDPKFRQTSGAHLSLPLARATHELERYIGRRLNFWEPENRPVFGGKPMPFPAHRSLTAVALATHLENAGLSWKVLDPGVQELAYWRRKLAEMRAEHPRTVAVSTTFIMSAPWLRTLCDIVRRELPDAKVIAGGYYYATNAKQFLSLDADVFCIGEGEVRFPAIVKALCAGRELDDIPGLYLRRPDGTLHHTGHVEPLNLSQLPPVDWSLAERVDPPVDLQNDAIEFGVETQRGCIFKCEFCTYRTLATPASMPPDRAAEAILQTGVTPLGSINMADSTATFPHQRWEEMMRELIARGGSPHPIWAFARVSDINEERADLMARAGVRQVFVGQESGDQRILNAMKKGTRIEQLRPAVNALGRHGIGATFGFIHGFPGETVETIQTTRSLIASLNDGFEDKPVVLVYLLYPFIFMDFAAVASRENLQGVDHYMGYEGAEITPQRAVEEVMATVIAVSRVPHAPPFAFLFEAAPATSGIALFSSGHRWEIFRWMKAVERGVAIFLERDLDGKAPDGAELRRLREQIVERYPAVEAAHRRKVKAGATLDRGLMGRLQREWSDEKEGRAGLLTRVFLGGAAWRDTAHWPTAWTALREGVYTDLSLRKGAAGHADAAREGDGGDDGQIVQLASKLVEEARARPESDRSWKKSWKEQALGRGSASSGQA